MDIAYFLLAKWSKYNKMEIMKFLSEGGTWYASCNADNADFEGIKEDSPLDAGGQSSTGKDYTLQD